MSRDRRRIAVTLIDRVLSAIACLQQLSVTAKKPLSWGLAIYPKCCKYNDDQSDPVPNPFRPAFGHQIPIATHGED
jgi:hypothetical protein